MKELQRGNFLLVDPITHEFAPMSANQRYSCRAMCKLCGSEINQAIEIPRFAVEKGKIYDCEKFCQDSEVVETEIFKALERNHGKVCKKKIQVIMQGTA